MAEESLGMLSLNLFDIESNMARDIATEFMAQFHPDYSYSTSWSPDKGEGSVDVSHVSEPVEEALTFRQELQALINKHSVENGSNTPDWILMEYLMKTLEAWELGANLREEYYGRL